MKAYKLTDKNGKTKNNTQWGENVRHEVVGNGQRLCSDGWIHFYQHPLLAVLLNPLHANFDDPILWEGITDGELLHESLKSGAKGFTTQKQIPLPKITTNQKIAFAILCAKKVCSSNVWNTWADNWLNNIDRNYAAAYNAAITAYAADAATYAIDAAVYAATNAAAAADAANAAGVASVDGGAASAIARSITTATFIELAEQAMTYN